MAEKNPPLYLQQRTDHTSEGDRSLLTSLVSNEGVSGSGDLKVTQNGTPGMSVWVAAGRAVVQGDDNGNQGLYHVWNDATATLTIAAADATNPRRDIIVARVKDAYYSGATNAFSLEVLTGTPAASPADPTVPNNCLPLARVAVAAAATSITNAVLTDLRVRYANQGGVVICTSTARPTTNLFEGKTIFETDTGRLYRYSSSAWWPAQKSHQAVTCQAYRASISVASATPTAVGLTSEAFDDLSMHDTVTNNTRITIPTGYSGKWLVSAKAEFNGFGGGNYRQVFVSKNAGGFGSTQIDSTVGVGTYVRLLPSDVLSLSAGDYLEVYVAQDAGTQTVSSVYLTATYLGN